MRGSVVFDECGFLDEEMMSVYAAFAIVNKSFKSGKDRDGKSIDRNRLRCIPSNIPIMHILYTIISINCISSTDTLDLSIFLVIFRNTISGIYNTFI